MHALFSLAQTTQQSIVDRLDFGQTLSETSLRGWIVLLCGIFGGMAVGRIAAATLKHLARAATAKGWSFRGIFFASFAGPVSLGLVGVGLAVGISNIVLSEIVRDYATKAFLLIYIYSLGWLVYNLVDIVDVALKNLTAKTESKLDDQLVPLVRKSLRVFVVVVFSLFVAENVFGANISTWLAGLGIAGLAVSLAAQDSIKNVFGSITIILDQPFQQGDVITFAGMTGSIEEIGFRSTRLRTLQGSLVTIPNSKLADSEVENLTKRSTLRRILNVTVTYDTPAAKLEEAVRIIREIFAEPEIAAGLDTAANAPRVFFDELNADSLNIKVFYWYRSTDYWAYLEHAQRFNLRLMRRFEAAGIEMAFPTRTLYLAGDPKRKLEVGIRQLAAE